LQKGSEILLSTDNPIEGTEEEIIDFKGELEMFCPVCGSSSLRAWVSKSGYNLMQCGICNHVSVHPIPPADEIHRGYSEVTETPYVIMPSADYYRYLSKDEANHIKYVSALVIRLVARYSSNPASRQWLDIGSGSGYLVEQARLAGWEAQGIEAGQWGEMAAQERNIPIIRGFFEEYEFGTQKFDVLSAIDVLEHTGDVQQFIRKCRSLARPGSLLLVAVPCSSSPHGWMGFLRKRWAMIAPPTHLQYFSHQSLVHLLDVFGFEPLEVVRYEVGGYPIGKLNLVRKLVDKAARFFVERLGRGDQILIVARSISKPG
jgi:SAM-dependent methyltransferase